MSAADVEYLLFLAAICLQESNDAQELFAPAFSQIWSDLPLHATVMPVLVSL